MEIKKLIRLESKDQRIEDFSFDVLDGCSFNNYLHSVNYKVQQTKQSNSKLNEKKIGEWDTNEKREGFELNSSGTSHQPKTDLIEAQFLNCCKLLDSIFKEAEEALLN